MPNGAGHALNQLGLYWDIEHSLLCFFSNSQGKTGGWSWGRICHHGPFPGKDQLLPIPCLVLSLQDPTVFSASLLMRTYGLAPENLSHLVNDAIYIFCLFFQWPWSPKEKNWGREQKAEGGMVFCVLRVYDHRQHILFSPLHPEPSVSRDHREPGCKVSVSPSTLTLLTVTFV